MSVSTTDRHFHILEEIAFLREHTSGVSLDDVWADEVLRRAVMRSIEIIGEAANRLPAEVWRTHAHVPWRAIVDQRNRLTHGYYNVDKGKIRDVLADYLPELRRNVEQIIEDERLG